MKLKSVLSGALALTLSLALTVTSFAAPMPDQTWTANWEGGTNFTASVTSPHDYLGAVKIGGLSDTNGESINFNFDVFVVDDSVKSLPYAMYTNSTKGFEADTLTMKNLYTVLDPDWHEGKVVATSQTDIGGETYSYVGTKADPFFFGLEVSPDRLNIANETLTVTLSNGVETWVGESAVILTRSQFDTFKSTGKLPPVYAGSIHDKTAGTDITSKLDLTALKDLLSKSVLSVQTTASTPSVPSIAKALPTTAKVTVDGKLVAFEAYNIGGNNYFKLRDIAKVVNGSGKQFQVTWDGTKKAINLLSSTPYTSVGSELKNGDGKEKQATLSTATVYKDGVKVSLVAYTINGSTFFKLRDVGQAFNFIVMWDNATRTVVVDTALDFVE